MEPSLLMVATATGGWLGTFTVKVVADNPQLVALLGVYVQPEPEMLEEPPATAVTVDPETVATEVLLETKVPPEKPAGAEAVEVWLTLIEEEERLTEPPGQEPACTVTCTEATLETAPGLSVILKTW